MKISWIDVVKAILTLLLGALGGGAAEVML